MFASAAAEGFLSTIKRILFPYDFSDQCQQAMDEKFAKLSVERVVAAGDPALKIVDFAGKNAIDLIMMAVQSGNPMTRSPDDQMTGSSLVTVQVMNETRPRLVLRKFSGRVDGRLLQEMPPVALRQRPQRRRVQAPRTEELVDEVLFGLPVRILHGTHVWIVWGHEPAPDDQLVQIRRRVCVARSMPERDRVA